MIIIVMYLRVNITIWLNDGDETHVEHINFFGFAARIFYDVVRLGKTAIPTCGIYIKE